MLADSPFRRVSIPTGDAGVDVTVDLMARMAMGEWGAQSPRIRQLAATLVANVPERDRLGEIGAVHRFVMDRLRYTSDPAFAEFLTHAETLAFDDSVRAGDCDDHSLLEAALLGAIGIPTRFVVIGKDPAGPYGHVYLEALAGPGWVALDPIMKQRPMGWEVPNPGRRKVYAINTPNGVFSDSIGGPIAVLACALLGWWAA